MLSDECAGWDDPDANPTNAQRVGPEWFAFQKRFTREFARKFPKMRGIDLDRLEADVELEFAKPQVGDVRSGANGQKPPDGANGNEKSDQQKAPRKRMTVQQANEKAMELAKKMKQAFFVIPEREQAKLIGCSWATWSKTDFYKKAKEKRPKREPKKPRGPKVESFTPGREAVTGQGERDESLNKLIAEQEADAEPSSLEDDPLDRPKKVHSRKRL